jgi:hypothetical protein
MGHDGGKFTGRRWSMREMIAFTCNYIVGTGELYACIVTHAPLTVIK